jgi:hypothetical protein
MEKHPINRNTANDGNMLLCAVPNTELKLKGGKNHRAFSRGLHKVFKDLIWVELHCKFGDLWFFNRVELMSVSEVELA